MADLPPPEPPVNGAPAPEILAPLAPSATAAPGLGTKRQRRPSVRLGDIGEQPAAAEPHVRRSKHWRLSSHHPHLFPHREQPPPAGGGAVGAGKVPSKMRPLTNLVSDESHDATLEIPVVAEDKGFNPGEEGLEAMVGLRRGGREGKARRGGGGGFSARRVRTNWVSMMDDGMEPADLKSSAEDAGDEAYRDFDDLRLEDSGSPMKEHSPSDRRAARARGSESREGCPVTTAEAEDVDILLERDGRDWIRERCHSVEEGGGGGVSGGVRVWLNGLGLGRYAPVFEIHEVDDEVLPLLTLDDLKDMGITAVGSRRKMYCAIQKLGKGLS